MSDILDPREELAILLALEQLEGGDPARQAIAGSPEPDVPVREHIEIFGLLAQSLEPIAPRPELLARVMTQLTTAHPQPTIAWPPASTMLPPPEQRLVDDMTLIKTAEHPPAAPSDSRPAPRRRNRWLPLAMAAALAFCMVGLGWLAWRTNEQQTTITQLTRQLENADRSAAENRSQFETAQSRLETTRRRLEMITTTARRVYALQPVGSEAPDAGPHGLIFVCGMHQQWYMSLKNLVPPPPGQQYFLWFLDGDNQPLEGRAIELEGTTGELDARSMPYGTRAFMVTLEPAGGSARPEGQMVILGDESVAL